MYVTEEVQITIHVECDFGFVFSGIVPYHTQEHMTWTHSSLGYTEASMYFSKKGKQMLQQILSLCDAVSLKVTPQTLAVTFTFLGVDNRDFNFYRRQMATNIGFYLPDSSPLPKVSS